MATPVSPTPGPSLTTRSLPVGPRSRTPVPTRVIAAPTAPSAPAPAGSVSVPGRAGEEDTSTLLWEPFADWEYRPDPDGYVEDLGAPELWTWERAEED